MGTHVVSQKRGHGGPAYRTPGHRFFGKIAYSAARPEEKEGCIRGQVVEFVDDPGRSAIIACVLLENGEMENILAPEGMKIGDIIEFGKSAKIGIGSIAPLGMIPEGMPVFNLEIIPGDGGKLIRASGSVGYVVSHDEETNQVGVRLASKKVKIFYPDCRATIGVACGGGHLEKPFRKAGNKFYHMHARNKRYPITRGTAMNAYDHPHGGRSYGTPSTVSRTAPPGLKVGLIAARRTGRKRGKIKSAEEMQKQG